MRAAKKKKKSKERPLCSLEHVEGTPIFFFLSGVGEWENAKTENYLRPQTSLQFIKFGVCCALTAALASPATTPLPVFPPAGESSAQLVSRRNETLDLLRLMEFRSNFFIS